jgi:hypothetical protein
VDGTTARISIEEVLCFSLGSISFSSDSWFFLLTAANNPEQEEYSRQSDEKKDDSALAVKSPGQEARIDACGEHCEDKYSQSILGDRQRDGHGDDQDLSPE